jgi:murein DD-endopeptidase MepM/ murein hydrolase activator NlpD
MPPATPTASQVSPTSTADLRSAFQICSPLEIHPLEELPEIISDPYRPPPPGKEQRHHGVDFSYYRRGERTTIQGVGVQAVLAGRTAAAIQDRFPYGNMIIIETGYDALPGAWAQRLEMKPGESIYTLYAHMDGSPGLNLGDPVDACQLIGAVGKSGNTVEPHLHLEMRLGPAGQSFTSMAYYGAKDSEEERSNYVRWRTGGEFQHFDPMIMLRVNPPS